MMNDFRASVRNLKFLGMKGLLSKKNTEDLPHIKKMEQYLDQQSMYNLTSIPCNTSLKELLEKLSTEEEISAREKRDIPFVLFDEKCEKKIFLRSISMLDVSKKSHVKRLFLVYLLQYDGKSYKTMFLAQILQRILEKKPFQTGDKLLVSGMNNTKILFGNDRMKYVAALIAKLKDIENVLKILSIPTMLKDCKFIVSALGQYYQTKSYSLDDQYSLFESIRNMDNLMVIAHYFP